MGYGKTTSASRRLGVLVGLLALTAGFVVLAALPLASVAGKDKKQGQEQEQPQEEESKQSDPVENVVENVEKATDEVTEDVEEEVEEVAGQPEQQAASQNSGTGSNQPSSEGPSGPRIERQAAQTTEPETDPPLHGGNPHGQGTVGVIDFNPSNQRPLSGDPSGAGAGEEIVVGRSRGEQQGGKYHGHVVLLSAVLVGEVVSVDTNEGEEQNGPLQPLQDELDNICTSSGGQLCLTVVALHSKTTKKRSENSFELLAATVGGSTGITARVASSEGNIEENGSCQKSEGSSSVADVSAGGQAVAQAGFSETKSKACNGGSKTQQNNSFVLGLGGQGVPLPAAGCESGEPDTVTGVPPLVTVVCNADDKNGGQTDDPYGVREALSVFVLSVDSTSLVKTTVADAESAARPPGRGDDDDDDDDGDDDDGDEAGAVQLELGAEAPAPRGLPPGAGPQEEQGVGPTSAGRPRELGGKRLPFTGSDVLSLVVAGLLLVAAGMVLRRRPAGG
jgi:hypothetical protein